MLRKVWETDITFDLDLLTWIERLYLHTKFEASWAKCCWFISCTSSGRLTRPLTFTWISIEIIYSPRTIYLPSLKLLGQRMLHKVWETDITFDLDLLTWIERLYLHTKFEASWAKCCRVISCTSSGRLTRPLTLTFDLNINRDHLPTKEYLPTKFEACGAKQSWVICCPRCGGLTWPLTLAFDLLSWILRDHLLTKDYLPTKFEVSHAKHCWVICCTRCGRLTWPLTLTWISLGIIYSPRTIYLLSLKLLWQSVVELSVAQGVADWHELWPWPEYH